MNSRPAIVRAAVCARPGCVAPLEVRPTGRPRRYCSATCRAAEHDRARRQALRDARLEEELRDFRRRRRALTSSDSVEWYTPVSLLEELLLRHLGAGELWDLDPAADPRAPAWSRARAHFTRADDGLAQQWRGRVWLNPPYGTALRAWTRKAIAEVQAGRVELVVLLVPARPDTGWWAELLAAGAEVEFRRGRLRFLEPDGDGDGVRERVGAPFPSAVIVLRRRPS